MSAIKRDVPFLPSSLSLSFSPSLSLFLSSFLASLSRMGIISRMRPLFCVRCEYRNKIISIRRASDNPYLLHKFPVIILMILRNCLLRRIRLYALPVRDYSDTAFPKFTSAYEAIKKQKLFHPRVPLAAISRLTRVSRRKSIYARAEARSLRSAPRFLPSQSKTATRMNVPLTRRSRDSFRPSV